MLNYSRLKASCVTNYNIINGLFYRKADLGNRVRVSFVELYRGNFLLKIFRDFRTKVANIKDNYFDLRAKAGRQVADINN